MRGQILGLGERDDVARDVLQRGFVVVHDVNAAEERLHRQPAGVPCAARGGQHVVGARAVVTEADRRIRPDENRARRSDPAGHLASVDGLDLEVFGRVGVDGADPASMSSTSTIADCRPLSAAVTRSRCTVVCSWIGQFALGGVGQLDARR